MEKYLYDMQKCSILKEVRQGYILTLILDLWIQERLPGRDFWIAILESFPRQDAKTAPVYRVAQKSPPRAAAALVCTDKCRITEPIRCMSMAMLPYYFFIKSNDKRNVIQRTPPIRHQC